MGSTPADWTRPDPTRRRRATAGQGLEPRFCGPEPHELPLFDPARALENSHFRPVGMRTCVRVKERLRCCSRSSRPGFTEAQIAWRLGVAPTTVSYHRARLLARPHAPERQRTASTGSRFRRVETRRLVGELLNEGLSRSEAARRLGLSKATISYHARRLGAPVDERCARRYDWAAVQQYYDLGHSVRECRAAFGFTSQTWHAAVQRGSVIPRPHPMPIEQLLAEGCPRNRQHIKRRLISAGLRTDRCEGCGLQHWRGMRVSHCPPPHQRGSA